MKDHRNDGSLRLAALLLPCIAGLALPDGVQANGTLISDAPSFYDTHRALLLGTLYALALLLVASLSVSLFVFARKNRQITAQSAALTEIKNSLTRAQRIARTGNWDWDIANDTLYWSDGIYELFGVDRQHFKPSYRTFFQQMHPDDRQRVEDALAHALSGQRPYDLCHRIVLPDGQTRIVRENAEIVRDAAGRPLHMAGTVTDVTELKTTEQALRDSEEQLQRHRDHLEALVSSRTAELEAATRNAEAASQAKTEFLSRMSHELRTPLNAIIGYSQLMESDLEDSGNAQTLADLKKVTVAAQHLLSIIEAVLEVSRVGSGTLKLALNDIKIGTLLKETLAAAGPLMAKNNNRLSVDCTDHEIVMHTDDDKLKQVLVSLLRNAANFCSDGEIKLTAKADGPETAGSVLFSVSDTGVGISASNLSKLFMPFSQVDGSMTRKVDGAGLGLYLSKQFIGLLGGSIGVSSEPGVGSTFTVRVPVRASGSATTPQ